MQSVWSMIGGVHVHTFVWRAVRARVGEGYAAVTRRPRVGGPAAFRRRMKVKPLRRPTAQL